ncbi:MAG: hypothetical protein JW780_03170, partial [Clostridiales bacterium]|nr:hypothetical protein [Clostridiales bacterium]
DKSDNECVSFEKVTDINGNVEYSVQEQDFLYCTDSIYTPYICASTNNDFSMGLFDLTTGQFVTEEIYTSISFRGDASEFAFTRKETRYGVLDSASGRPILESNYQWVAYSPDG